MTDAPVTAVCRDILADHLFAAVGADVVKLFAGGRREGAALGHDGDAGPGAAGLGAGRWRPEPVEPVQVHWYGDGQLRYTAVLDGIETQRLPPGRWLEQEVEVVSRARLTKVFMAPAQPS